MDVSTSGPRATLLVVDDDPDIRALLHILLGGEGYGVVLAANGAEALGLAERHRPDLILLDVTMPRLTGADFCRAYRARGGRAPVIVLSASLEHDVIQDTLNSCGADDFIAKPFDIERLLAAVARHLPTR